MAGKTKIPVPGRTFRDGAIKYAVEKSCKAVAGKAIRSTPQGGGSESDQKVVVDQICMVVSMTTDALLKGENMSATDVGIHLTKQNVNLLNLSKTQQVLCVAALADLSINSYKAVEEYLKTFKDTRTAAAIGSICGPEGTAIFGGAAFASHLPDLIHKSSKMVNSALDAHSQCGPLVLDKTAKPRAEVGATPISGPR